MLLCFEDNLEFAKDWIEYTCKDFPLLLNPERQVYRDYGLERSRWRSSGLRTFWRSFQIRRSGQRWFGIHGDTAQLGGDFVIDETGVIRLAYRSHDPTDRPSVDQLLSVLTDLH